MSKSIARRTPSTEIAHRTSIQQAAVEFLEAARAPASERAYRADLAHYEQWCGENGVRAIPATPETVAAYLTALAAGIALPAVDKHGNPRNPRKQHWAPASIARRCCTIARAHRLADLPDPTKHERVRTLMDGIRRKLGTRQAKKAPILPADLRKTVGAPAVSPKEVLRKAVILMGFAGCMRESEVCALDVSDVEFVPEGMRVTLRFRKTDQEGRGTVLGILRGENPAVCPVEALRAWMKLSKVEDGALFLSVRKDVISQRRLNPNAVWKQAKDVAALAGHDKAVYGGHSLRAGWMTAAAKAGVQLPDMMRHSGHQTPEVALGYIRDADLFTKNPGKGLL